MDRNEYILTHRLAGTRSVGSCAEGSDALHEHVRRLTRHADVLDDSHGSATQPSRRRRRIVRVAAPPAAVRDAATGLHPEVVVEARSSFRSHASSELLGVGREMAHVEAAASRDVGVEILVKAGGTPLGGADVSVLYRTPDGATRMLPPKPTDADGRIVRYLAAGSEALLVGAYPAQGYWSACVASPGTHAVLECEPLPTDGPLAWWHRIMGIEDYAADAGSGIRVGILGTGVTAHPCLSHVRRVDDKGDLGSHGTHVCGIVGARPVEPGQFAGFAPGATILTRRVFEMENGRMTLPDQGVLAHGIDAFSSDADPGTQVDLINMSLGGNPSAIVTDAILHAREHGTVCVCSAGNTSGEVEFPASMEHTIGVSALGRWGWGAQNSVTVYMTPDPDAQPTHFGHDDLFLGKFSCFGPTIAAAAPGAGVISTVPPTADVAAPYAVMDGTSLSSPAVTGVIAALMSRSAEFRSLARDGARADAAWELFRRHCVDVGLQEAFQGSGMPSAQPLTDRPIRSRRPSKRESPRSGSKPGITAE